jgi:hypothetical protein
MGNPEQGGVTLSEALFLLFAAEWSQGKGGGMVPYF